MSEHDRDRRADAIAIVGMAGRFPRAADLQAFWRNLWAGEEAVTFFSRAELLAAGVDRTLQEDPAYVPARAILEHSQLFDADFFGFSLREAEITNPQHRVFLECCWQALEDAGYDPATYPGAIGVFASASSNTYLLRIYSRRDLVQQMGSFRIVIANDREFLPTWVSYKLDLKGPSINVQTACSSSLVALHIACQSLLNGECDLALTGGVSIRALDRGGYLHQEGGILSPDGHCRAFDADAAGTVDGDGVGVVALKRLEDALADGDNVHALVLGSAVNNDGSSKAGYTAPSKEGQTRVITEALSISGVDPGTVSYVEAHGTGTRLGDPVEVSALSEAFRAQARGTRSCALGSVKTNIGHLDAASGVAGLIKTVLALRHRRLPPSLHFRRPNPEIDFAKTPFYVNASPADWPSNGHSRRAGVSSFGIGGTNAHVVLEEAPPLDSGPSHEWQLLVWSARTDTALETATADLARCLAETEKNLADIAYTLRGRRAFPRRRALVCRNAREAAAVLGRPGARDVASSPGPARKRSVAFLFPGQGAQRPGMTLGLYRSEPVFRAEVDLCAERLRPHLGGDLREVLYPAAAGEEAERRLLETAWAQPALFTVEWALARLWASWGIEPQALLGHSVGEYVAACVAGTLDLDGALTLIAARGRLMQSQPAGAMLSVPLCEQEVQPLLGAELSLAAVNAPRRTVISGPLPEIEDLERRLAARGIEGRRLRTSHAFHSRMMDPVLPAFAERVRSVSRKAPKIPYLSNVTGDWVSPAQTRDADFWVRQLRSPVRFSDAVARLLYDPDRVLIEVGPGQALTGLALHHPDLRESHLAVPSLHAPGHPGSEAASLLDALGRLWVAGVDVDWGALTRGERRRRVSLPTYPFERQKYWIEPRRMGSPTNEEPRMPEPTPITTPESVRRDLVLSVLKEIVRDLTGADPSAVDSQASFLEVGVDSLLLIQATQRLQDRFGVKLSLVQLLEELNTLDSVATYLTRELPEVWFPASSRDAPAPIKEPPVTGPSAVAGLPPADLSAPVAPVRPALPAPPPLATAPASVVERVVAQQLQLMAYQLQLLQGTSASSQEAAAAPAPAPPAAPRPVPHTPKPVAFTRFGPYHPVEVGPKGGLTPRQQAYLDAFIRRYNARTARSKQMTQAYRPVLADSRASVGFRRLWKELVYPIHAERAKGSRIWDLDGNEYVDINMGFGLHFFGHSPDFVSEVMERQMRTGLALGPQSPLAGRAAELVCELTGMDRAVFCNSGTEAVMGALRAARTFTRRSKIALFSQSYHGWADPTLARAQVVDGRRISVPVAPGVPPGALEDVLVLDDLSPKTLEELERHGDELAAVLVEPVRSRSPEVQPRELLRQVRELTDRSGTVLIFDEMVTGFRIHPGGAQADFGIEADLATYGKLIAGGLPIGVVAGRSRFMDVLDGGMWSFGDDSYPTAEKTLMAGAFFKHPLTMAAACAILERMRQEGPALHARLNARTAQLAADLNDDFSAAGVPIEMVCYGSLFRFRPAQELQHADLFFYHLLEKGIFYTLESGNCFLTTVHTEEDLARLRSGVRQSLGELQEAGFLPGPPSGPPRERREWTIEVEAPAQAAVAPAPDLSRDVNLGLYYFGNYAAAYDPAKYELLIEGARFADQQGFSGIWLPERHFHPFGGLSPNPAVLAAALARETKRLQLRAGSAVVPLHHPIRLAEDWSLVDNLSEGRAGVSFASGWHANDFILAPHAYGQRHEVMYEGIEKVRALWRGRPLRMLDGAGKEVEVYLHPLPRQREIPVWLTAGSTATFVRAGELGVGVLTNLHSQSIGELGRRLELYREALVRHGHGLASARVTLLLHTFVGPDLQRVREQAEGPLRGYLRSSLHLTRRLLEGSSRSIDLESMPEEDLNYLLGLACRRYMADSSLIGTPETCAAVIETVRRLGVTEIGCLIDFGLDTPSVLEGLPWLAQVQRQLRTGPEPEQTQAPAVVELPLTEPHRDLWIASRMEGGSAYNEPLAMRLRGPLDLAALRAAFQAVVERHGTLRATFSHDGLHQRIAPSLSVDIPLTDLSGLGPRQRAREAERWLARQAADPFDLERGPLVRCAAARLEERDHYLSLTLHHLVIDGHSGSVMLRDLCALYAAARRRQPSPLGRGAAYEEYVHRAEEKLNGSDLARAKAYWTGVFADAVPRLELPADRPRSQAAGSAGALRTRAIDPARLAALRSFGAAQGVTLFAVLLATCGILLHRLSGEDDLVVGVPSRDPEAGAVVGYFINLLLVRLRIAEGESFRELAVRVRRTLIEGQEHRRYPLSHLLEQLRQREGPGRCSVTATFNVDRSGDPPPFADIAAELVRVHQGASRFEAEFTVLEGRAPRVECGYRTQLFDATTIDRWLGIFERLLDAIAANPESTVGELPCLSESELHQVRIEWNPASATARPGTVHELFQTQADLTPDAVAVTFGEEYLTYRELDRRANRLARRLVGLGGGPEMPVGVLAERSSELIIALLGILKTGGAYAPLDPAHPPERLAALIEDLQTRLVLAPQSLAGRLPSAVRVLSFETEREPVRQAGSDRLALPAEPDGLAYVMYTSGSSGRPKGVAVTHRAVVRLVRDTCYADFSPDQVWAQLAPMAFDASTLETWGALLHGGRLAVFPPGPSSLAELGREVHRHAVSSLWLTAGLFHQIVEENLAGLSPVSQLLAGGDVLSPDHVRRALAGLPGCRLINGYGPTENTTFTCCHSMDLPEEVGSPVPIGRPIAGTRVWVLDRLLRPVPLGAVGELYTGGEGLARGYLHRPELTAERFVPDPCGGNPGDRLYRTGDRVRFRSDGTLEFLGRADRQVKLRGFRVEPAEVEVALAGHPGVREAAVVVLGEGRDRRLVAFVSGEVDAGSLRRFLEPKLPAYMVPSVFRVLEALPLTPNGKVDRRALAKMDSSVGAGSAREAPRTVIEQLLAGFWEEVLGREAVGIRDDFFEMGGHSLLATRLVSRIRFVLGVELPLQSLFEAPTVAGLAAEIESLLTAGKRAEAPPIRPVPRSGKLPPSYAQQRLWFLDQLDPGSPTYNIPSVMRLAGTLDPRALAASLNGVVARHEALRTTFGQVDGEVVQRIASQLDLPLPLVDLSGLTGRGREAEARRLASGEARRPFDLAAGPLVRATLVRLEDTDHIVLLTMHHIISDGWSMGILIREVAALYSPFSQGPPSPLPPLPIQYADYAVWQRSWLEDEEILEQQLAYWRKRLDGAPALLDLPTDRPRPPVQRFRGGQASFSVPKGVAENLRVLGRRRGATMFMVMLAAYDVLLRTYTGQDDLPVGVPIAGRNQAESEALIGFFVNMLVLRTDLGGSPSFEELLDRVREVTLEAYAYQDLPFEKLVEDLQPERSLNRSPLFQVVFAFQNLPQESLRLTGLTLKPLGLEGSRPTKFDLTLMMADAGQSLAGTFEYITDLFNASTVHRMANHFTALLEKFAANPSVRLSALSLLIEAEQAQVLREWNDTAVGSARGGLIHEMIAAQAERAPDALALLCEERAVSYRDLTVRASRLAAFLRLAGVRLEDRIGVCLEPSPEMIVALLGILQAGGVYVPLDPGYPAERRTRTLEDAGVEILVTQERFREALSVHPVRLLCLGSEEVGAAGAPEVVPVDAGNAAYVIYTSGSTGVPKGVVAIHGGLASFARSMAEALALDPRDRVLQFASLAFDAAAVQIFPTLARGATLVLHPNPRELSADELLDLCARTEVTVLDLPAALWRQWIADVTVSEARIEAPIRMYLTGGEAVPASVLRDWAGRMEPETGFLSSYGPTEATVTTTTFQTTSGEVEDLRWEEVPMGRPLTNVQVYVLDARLAPVPIGVPGEVWIGGIGVTRGYFRRPAATAERYVPNPWAGEPGGRLYRSGDLARWLADGSLQFLGRRDHQVKIRGFRIELGEIEAAIRGCPEVRDLAVVLHEDRTGGRRLVACVVPEEGVELSPLAILAALREVLPAPLVPSYVLPFSDLPLTTGGKVDRRELARRVGGLLDSSELRREMVLPRTPTELKLARIWEELLDIRPIGIRDNFFDLGGHSLLAVRLRAWIQARLGQDLPLATLFEEPTVEHLGRRLDAASGGPAWSPLVSIQPEGQRTPFFCVHPIGGGVLGYRELAQHLGPDQPFYGLQAPGLEVQAGAPHTSIEEMASAYLSEIRGVQPSGPYRLGGWSFGGVIAFEMAQQLYRQGEEVEILSLFDTPVPQGNGGDGEVDLASAAAVLAREQARQQGRQLELTIEDLQGLPLEEQLGRILEGLREIGVIGVEIDVPLFLQFLQGFQARLKAVERYQAKSYPGRVHLFRPLELDPERLRLATTESLELFEDPALGWGKLAEAGVQIYRIPGYHDTMLSEPYVRELARLLDGCISQQLRVSDTPAWRGSPEHVENLR